MLIICSYMKTNLMKLFLLNCLLVFTSGRRGLGGRDGRGPKGRLICSDGCKPVCSDDGSPISKAGSKHVGVHLDFSIRKFKKTQSRPDCAVTCRDGSEPARIPGPCERERRSRPSCRDLSRPVCRDGSPPRRGVCGDGQAALCQDGQEPLCDDGTRPLFPPICPK